MVTKLKDIADIAKVSNTAVSAVLSGRKGSIRVSEQTRQKITTTANLLGYVPNYLARGLKGGTTNSISVLWSLNNYSGSYFLRSLSQKMQKNNYFLQPVDHLSDPFLTSQVLTHLHQRGTDAVIIQGNKSLIENEIVFPKLTKFSNVIVVCPENLEVPFDIIVRDSKKPFLLISEYFVSKGRRKPAFLGSINANNEKLKAFAAGFEKNRDFADLITIDYDIFRNHKNSDLILFLEHKFPDKVPFDCISCTNDDIAGVVMKWLDIRRMKIPQDVAVFGFDNSSFAELLTPSLASVERKELKLAEMIADLIFEKFSNPSDNHKKLQIDMELVLRASAG